MDELVFVLMLISVIVIILGILTLFIVLKRRKVGNLEEPNFKVFFILGICFLPMGIIFSVTISTAFIGIAGMGIIYLIIGLANRHKWENK
jgi:hypothetical protein